MHINNKIKFSANIHKPEKSIQISENNREQQMIPTYLELAQIDGEERFNKKEIVAITKAFKYYSTKLSITDILKELLSIGKDKGKVLTTSEIINFIEATSGLKQLEQKNVIKFIKIAKENEHDKITIESIKESMPYAKFRDFMLHNKHDKKIAEREKDWFSEENIKRTYKNTIENEYKISSNEYLQKVLYANRIKPIEYINKENRTFVEAVAKCNDPKAAYDVITRLGVTPSITASLESLSTMWKISNENKSVIIDLSRGFYASEIKQICAYFKSQKNNKELMNALKYHIYNIELNYNDGTLRQQNLQRERTRFLKEFDLEDKIILKPLVNVYKEDVYPSNTLLGRGTKITKGNFEAGKNK